MLIYVEIADLLLKGAVITAIGYFIKVKLHGHPAVLFNLARKRLFVDKYTNVEFVKYLLDYEGIPYVKSS